MMLLGGLTGRLDQTAHTLSTLLQLRKTGRTIWAFSQMSMACVLDQVRSAQPSFLHALRPMSFG